MGDQVIGDVGSLLILEFKDNQKLSKNSKSSTLTEICKLCTAEKWSLNAEICAKIRASNFDHRILKVMPYPMKIQPIDFNDPPKPQPKCDTAAKPVSKSRFKRLFERPFSNVLRTAAPDKPADSTEPLHDCDKDGLEEFEPSSLCLAKMVQNFLEESNEKHQRCGRNRCSCFNGNCTESSEEEPDSFNSYLSNACDVLKSLVPCLCASERNLLADTAKIVEKNKISTRKDGICRKIVADGLMVLGYNASICKSKWDKSPSVPAGEYEYVDVIIEAERLIIDIDFRSEFEIARSTKAYKHVLQTLPNVFVGKADRLEKVITTVSEAARLSLKKKGMPVPPWRKADYVKAKWLSPFTRITLNPACNNYQENELRDEKEEAATAERSSCNDANKLILGDKCSPVDKTDNGDCAIVVSNTTSSSKLEGDGVKSPTPAAKKWEPPEIRPKSSTKGVKIVTGLASVIEDKP